MLNAATQGPRGSLMPGGVYQSCFPTAQTRTKIEHTFIWGC
jgi:hypothetical protein